MALKGPISHGAVPYKSVLANDALGLYFGIRSEIWAIGISKFWTVEICQAFVFEIFVINIKYCCSLEDMNMTICLKINKKFHEYEK